MAVLNVAFCMTCNLFMLVEDEMVGDEMDDHIGEAYSKDCLITALYVAITVSFC